MARNCELVIKDAQGREKARYRVPYGARLLADEGSKVTRGQKLADWDPYTQPIITERDGFVAYMDIVEGISLTEKVDEATGISNRVVVDWRQHPKGANLKPRVVLRDANKNVIKQSNGLEARYFMSPDAVLNVENGAEVKAGDIIARIPRESAKTRDITGGLPRVAELFEARKPKDHAILADISGHVAFGKDYKNKRRITLQPLEGSGEEAREYLIPKGRHISVQEGDFVQLGDTLVEGPKAPHDILQVLGVEALAQYLINEIQDVYRLQGVKINDKHIEVIVRQMMQKVRITDPGQTEFLLDEEVDKTDFVAENQKALDAGHRTAAAVPLLMGITKAALQTHSFISAASFQETTRVLTEAAVNGKVDTLDGLKENVIVGRLIPAGTGSVVARLKSIAAERDRALGQIAGPSRDAQEDAA
jgi:DNA-directed RNA polymerase subunit beta'